MLLSERQNHVYRLAVQIADDAARSDIETLCLSVTAEGREPVTVEEIRAAWYDTSTMDGEGGRLIRMAVNYLVLRGLVVRHPIQRHWLRFVGW
ncbi:hypothetical protein EGT07_21730 [Herbaspirillum sp. HC18]|nr:hypothetical protein EGT07_21730 [Herbaspirillum sp. HC18]